MISGITQKLAGGNDLTHAEMDGAMESIMTGACSTGEIVAFLSALSAKGETIDEIAAAAGTMRRHAIAIRCSNPTILDTCGTGGDRKNSFNISTATAFVVAGCGVTIAKHGNRSVSSRCGSADILEALGVRISLAKEKVEQCLAEVGIAFLYAPDFHPAMKFAAPARKQIGRRTIFNVLGPLCNPAGATNQLIGVYSPELGPVIAAVCGKLGTSHCLAAHGAGVMDEITTTGPTQINEFKGGSVKSYSIAPGDFGFAIAGFDDLVGGDAADNARIMAGLFDGDRGPKRDIVVFNAGAAIYAADKAGSIAEGVVMANEALDSGAAKKKFAQLRDFTGR